MAPTSKNGFLGSCGTTRNNKVFSHGVDTWQGRFKRDKRDGRARFKLHTGPIIGLLRGTIGDVNGLQGIHSQPFKTNFFEYF